ncbi:MAG: acetamidase/formamidase family protein [Dethiosulfatibacter sp.]|nr:acetamidase/formamidase family protein [Dethiosulfatibacter sp.]
MKIIPKNHFVYAMSKDNVAVERVADGEVFAFDTMDAFSNQIVSETDLFESADWSTVNPATGPVYIDGAKPGDVIVVDILDIEVGETGVMVAVPNMGAVGHMVDRSESKIIEIKNGFALFNENIALPLDPMIGVIGVAPAGDPVPNGTPDCHGGNMDTKVIRKGNRVYLPVNVDGGLLALGDLHAVMSDGEVGICGVEVGGRVTVKVHILKDKKLETPVVESKDHWYVIGSGDDLDSAVKFTLDQTHIFLSSRLDLPTNDICMLMSLICDLQISQIVDPKITCRMAIQKTPLAQYNLSF